MPLTIPASSTEPLPVPSTNVLVPSTRLLAIRKLPAPFCCSSGVIPARVMEFPVRAWVAVVLLTRMTRLLTRPVRLLLAVYASVVAPPNVSTRLAVLMGGAPLVSQLAPVPKLPVLVVRHTKLLTPW